MNLRSMIVVCSVVVAATAASAADRFSLNLKELSWPMPDARTQARRAQWNAPMGRVAYEVAQHQASLGRSGLPRPSEAVALRVKLQPGLRPELMSVVMSGGVELFEQRVSVIRWPWLDDDVAQPALPLDEQVSLLLGRRLEVR